MKLLILLFLLILVKIILKNYFYKENFEVCSYEDYNKNLNDNLKIFNLWNDDSINTNNKYTFDNNSIKIRYNTYIIDNVKKNIKNYNKICNKLYDNKNDININNFKDNLEELYEL